VSTAPPWIAGIKSSFMIFANRLTLALSGGGLRLGNKRLHLSNVMLLLSRQSFTKGGVLAGN
jgi:hypothetical protein